MRYFSKVLAFILFVIAIKFFNDANMYWWLFMFGFIIVSGFIIGEEGIENEQVDAILEAYPKDWEDYKATYVEDEGDDGIIIDNIDDGVADGLEIDSETNYLNNTMRNRDAEIKYKTDNDKWEPFKSNEEEDIPF